MTKVITYGTYDVLHYGHIRLLERAKALGDYLIVGVTSDDYDRVRGKINLQQTLMERIEAVKATDIPDEVIVEEYEGQKIDDIQRYNVDIFAIGSDWEGQFDYLNEYCKVVYLPRTLGISSSELRSQKRELRMGFVCEDEERILRKFIEESGLVNGISVSGVYTTNLQLAQQVVGKVPFVTKRFDQLIHNCDALYILSHPSLHYEQIKMAIEAGKHVLVETPVTMSRTECDELFRLAEEKHVVLMESLKTAYSTAYNRLLLLVKSGKIGKVVSVDATCTSIRNLSDHNIDNVWNSICAWGPTAFLPIFQILGTKYNKLNISSLYLDADSKFDLFSKIDFNFDGAVASAKVGRGVKSEGELIISGTKGYVYVPAPWWKTDYFELRFEKTEENKRYFYQLDGEGIRYELVAFVKAATKNLKEPDENKENDNLKKSNYYHISNEVSLAIADVINKYYEGNITEIR